MGSFSKEEQEGVGGAAPWWSTCLTRSGPGFDSGAWGGEQDDLKMGNRAIPESSFPLLINKYALERGLAGC